MKSVLIVGGAGYIGSTMTAYLLDQKQYDITILDDLSTGHRRSVLVDDFVRARAGDRHALDSLFERKKFDCVFHFAAKSLVAESVEKPKLYFENNVEQTDKLLNAMLDHGIKNFIFSSTCAIFGDPGDRDIDEELEKKPINPYGETKLEVEKMLARLGSQRGLQSVALRYFNAAGGDPKGRVGEWHEPETHLIPRILEAGIEGRNVEMFGVDYPTPDGTAIRDYIHVWDLAKAHEMAMKRLWEVPGRSALEVFNLGSQTGFSVKQMVGECERAIGQKLNVVEKPRRAGDPPRLVANSRKALEVLEWQVTPNSLPWILDTAWAWQKKLTEIKKK